MGMRGGIEEVYKVDQVDPFTLLKEGGGWYKCPKDPQGNRLSYLVGYGNFGLQWVGDEYVNFAMIEENANTTRKLASMLANKINKSIKPESWDTICAVPEGGKTIGAMLALFYPDKRYIYPDQKQDERGVSVLTFGRHRINPGDRVFLVEDVVCNFTRVAKLCNVIDIAGGRVVGIVNVFNRSNFDDWFSLRGFRGGCVPLISLIRRNIKQHAQDDPYVKDDIAKRNVVWDPKKDWKKLVP